MTEKCVTWVVYRMTIYGKLSETSSVCEQGEWDAMERAQPGLHRLIQASIHSEAEAERLARGEPEVVKPSKPSRWKALAHHAGASRRPAERLVTGR